MYFGKTLLIATQHRKEEVIAPVFEQVLGVRLVVPPFFDTDKLGTFSGEVERRDGPLDTARRKCLLALEQYGGALCVASEGSFGPHPTLYFIPADEEWLFFMDATAGVEVSARVISTDTNFGAETIHTPEQLLEFARRARFPSHALILRPAKDIFKDMLKGISDETALLEHFSLLISKYGSAYVETDMRAMHNPSRMKVIAQAAEKLALRIATPCGACGTPGFGVTGARTGLPCAWCGTPTRSVISHIWSCQKCGFSEEKMYPEGKQMEEAMYCDVCNP